MAGVDQVLITRVVTTATTAQVTRMYRQICTAGSFGSQIELDPPAPYPAGLESPSGLIHVESRIPYSAIDFPSTPQMRLGFDVTDGFAVHHVLSNGCPIIFPAPGATSRRRAADSAGGRGRREFVLDGLVPDWPVEIPALEHGMGAAGTSAVRLLRIFAFANDTDDFIYFRFDAFIDNNGPFAQDDKYWLKESEGLLSVGAPGVLANDGDPSGKLLNASPVSTPAHGNVVLNPDGSFTYSPDGNFTTDTFEYKATNGSKETNVAKVTIEVSLDPPEPLIAVGDKYNAIEDMQLVVGAPGVLLNDTGPKPLVSTLLLLQPPTKGHVILNGDGAFTYTPHRDVFGVDSFTYMLSNCTDTNYAAATVEITIADVNDAPVAADLSFTTNEEVPVTVTLSAMDGGSMTFAIVSGPSNGTLGPINPATPTTATVTYTPNLNFFGTGPDADSFTYTANNGVSNSNVATVTINVNPVNDPPSFTSGGNVTSAEDTAYSAPWATSISAGPTNESSQTLTFNVTDNTNPALFSVAPSIAPDGTLSYTPVLNAIGSADITVTLSDNGGGSDTSAPATFTINITPVNDPPTFTSGGDVTVNEDSGAYSNAWAAGISPGPADESGQTVAFNITNNSNPSLFSVAPAISSTGVLSFTTAAGQFGSANITVTLSDNGGGTNTSAPVIFTITLNPVNDPPSFTGGPDVIADSNAGAFSMSAWATAISRGPANESAETLTFEVTGNTNAGLFTSGPAISDTGTLTFTPLAGAVGSATITIQLRDSGGTANAGSDVSATDTFTITLDAAPTVSSTVPANTAPGVVTNSNLSITFSENVAVAGNWFQIVCATSGTRNVIDTVVTGGPLTFTINPNADFVPNESCTVTVFASQVTDLDVVDGPDNMAANYVFSYTTDAQPAVASTNPFDTAVGVTTNANIGINFTEDVNVTGNWFQIVCSTSGTRNVIDTVVTGGPLNFTVNPSADFVQGESCTVTIFAAQVADQDANDPPDNMAADHVFTFAIDAAPSVTTTVPGNADFSQQPNSDVTVTFSEAVNVTGNWFQIVCGTTGTRNVSDTAVSTSDNITFTINPNVDFAIGESCALTIFAAQVADQDGNDPPDNMVADHVVNFGFDAPPSVTATTPPNDPDPPNLDQTENTDITITFSENVNVSGNWFLIVCNDTGTRNVADTVVAGGPMTYTINPNADFSSGETCTVTVFAAQVADQDTNDPPDNMAANHVFSFSIDVRPSVIGTTPSDGATDRPANQNITLQFNQPVNVTGNWFQIVCTVSGTRNVADTVVTGGPTIYTINPNTDFTPPEPCTVTVFAAQVTDVDSIDPPDNPSGDYVFSFSIDNAPSVSATTPTNGAPDQASNTGVTITFSEPVNVTGNWFQIVCTMSGTRNVSDTVVTGGPTTFSIDPNTDFTPAESCTVTVFAAQVADQDANDPPDNMLADYPFTFAIDAAPSVMATTPADTSPDEPTNTDITITFSENVNVAGNWFQVVCDDSGTRNVSDTVVTGGPMAFTINPNADFTPADEECTVTIFAVQVTDQDGNDPPDNMTADYPFSFNFDAAPAVDSTNPTDDNIDIVSNTDITIAFTEDVNVSGNWFQIVCATSGMRNVSDTVVTGGPLTFTINPNADFTAGENCVVTVFAAQVADQDTNDPPDNMNADRVFDFTIDAAPSVSSTTPLDDVLDVVANTDVTITFSENVNVTGNWFQIVCGITTYNVADTVVTGGPLTFTINPNTDFPEGTNCVVTVFAAQVTDQDANDPPDNMLANHVFDFTIDDAPEVSSTTPDDGATGVVLNASVDVTFSENVNVTGNWFQIVCGVSGTRNPGDTNVTGGPLTFTINPNADFVQSETCMLTVFAAQIADQDSNDPPDNMTTNEVVTFQIDEEPTVTATVPVNGSNNADPTADLSITFSEAVNVTGNWFQIVCTLTGTRNVSDTVVTGGPTTFTINPNADFAAPESCTWTTFAAQVTDQDGNDPPDNMGADHVVMFQTDQPPAVLSTTPPNDPAPPNHDQATNTNITITFTEPVNVAGNWFQIVCTTSGMRNVSDTVVTGGPMTFTVNPNADFAPFEVCTVTVFAAGVTDADANDPPDNMVADHVFTFSTDAAPVVTATTPVNDPAPPNFDQTTNTDITLTFSEPVNVSGNWFQIVCNVTGTRNVADTVVTGGPTVFTINPNADFAPNGDTCSVTVFAAQVTDQDGIDPPDNMPANHMFTFSTDTAPGFLTLVPASGATNVAINTNVTLTFSEPVNVTGNWFQINCPTSGLRQVSDTVVTGGPTVFTIDPNADFSPTAETCVVTVFDLQVSDQDSIDPPDHMGGNFGFSFTTDAAPFVQIPTVPANNAVGIAKNTNITITFSEPVNVAGTWFQVVCNTQTQTNLGSVVSGGPTTWTINPNADLQPGNVCTATVFAAQVTDVDSGDPPDNMIGDHVWTFSVPPEAVADDYKDADGNADPDPTVVGNVSVNTDTSTEFSILTNDQVGPGVTINLPGGAVTTNGGTIVVAASGKFTYTPPRGFEGADTFSYNISNASGTSANAAVTITVAGMIWFIDAAYVGTEDGRFGTPYNTLAEFQAVNNGTGSNPAAGDNIFIYENGSSYTGPVTLLSNQKLIGQDATVSLATISGVSVPPDSFALPVMNTGGNSTTINGNPGGVNAVNLNAAGTGNTVRGMTLTTGTTTSGGLVGATFGTLTTADLIISGSGPALSLTTGTLAGTMTSVSSSGGAFNVSLSTIDGSSNFGTGALSGATTDSININGGNASITYSGTISNSTQNPLDIRNKTGGTIALSGTINGTGSGIFLDNNDQAPGVATINLSGAITLNTGANAAFTATNGGTVTASASTNTITTTSGAAVTITGTDIGAADVVFQSINKNGGTTAITLTSTGTAGNFRVTGTGTTDGSGGTIQNTSADAIALSTTRSVVLKNMIIGDSSATDTQNVDTTNNIGGDGISSTSVTPLAGDTYGLELDNVKIARTGGSGINGSGLGNIGLHVNNSEIFNPGDAGTPSSTSADEDGIAYGSGANPLTGTALIENTTIAAMVDSGFQMENFGGSGTLNITFTNVTIKNNDALTLCAGGPCEGSAIQLIADGSSGGAPVINLTVNTLVTSEIDQDILDIIADPGGTIDVTSNGITASSPAGDNVLRLNSGSPDADDDATFTFDIQNVTVTNMAGTVVQTKTANAMSGTLFNSTLDANDLGNTLASRGMEITGDGDSSEVPSMTIDVNNVTFNRIGGDGIQPFLSDVVSASSRIDVTIRNCNIGTNPANTAQTGLEIGRGNASANEAIEVRNFTSPGQIYINIDNNNIRNFTSANASAQAIDIDSEGSSPGLVHATVKRNDVFAAPGATDYTLDAEAGTNTLCADFGTDDGPDGANTGVDAALTQGGGTFNVEGGTGALAGNNPGLAVSTSGSFGSVVCTMPNLP